MCTTRSQLCWKRIYRAQTVLRYRKAQVEVIDSAHAATIEYVVLSTFGIFFFYDFCDRPWCTGQMTETPENSSQPPSQPLASLIPRSSRWKRPTLAVLLSLVFPGMGQLYNRQPRKAFSLALITYILDFLMVKTRLLFAFSTMVVTILALGLWKLFVAAEAGYAAAAAKKPEPPVPMPRLIYPILAVLFFAAVFVPFPDLKSEAGFASFKVPSASMCPTICLGERFVADMHAYKLRPPQRGDLILMKHSSSGALFIK